MTILLTLLMPLAFAAAPVACEPEFTTPVIRLEVTLDGFDAIAALMEDLPPESAPASRVLKQIGRRLRYGFVPDVNGDILDHLHDLRSSFEAIARTRGQHSDGQFEMIQSRSNALQVSAAGAWRRLLFPHRRFATPGEQSLAYVQQVSLKNTVRGGQSSVALTLTLAFQGNLELLTPADRALVERARTDGATLLPAGSVAVIEHQD